ncbi:spore coat protein CotJB [Paenibacillus sp. MWE-103]|uniref:Spore coat protein CotJB n=1 Tax=Paenibacillus artemisiicola TaxID=1172618 RepID=A0ABS3W320_9BACL|nr:spore coat protein CotJB [Paenibacillus artemisiicola]MBO7742692.1 spore coat protein CotJB [Paenibacillus artemisiicola]
MKQPTIKAMNQLEQLQAVDFAIVELRLYLDTHPGDAEAQAQLDELAGERLKLKEQVEADFGPLCSSEASRAGQAVSWSEGPWPWQL